MTKQIIFQRFVNNTRGRLLLLLTNFDLFNKGQYCILVNCIFILMWDAQHFIANI